MPPTVVAAVMPVVHSLRLHLADTAEDQYLSHHTAPAPASRHLVSLAASSLVLLKSWKLRAFPPPRLPCSLLRPRELLSTPTFRKAPSRRHPGQGLASGFQGLDSPFQWGTLGSVFPDAPLMG